MDNLERLKNEYSKIEKKFNLPNFKYMNEEFEIDKMQDKESEILIRDIRRVILEKATAYLKFVEMFLNPTQAPMFFLSLIRNIPQDSRKTFEELYLILGKYEIRSIFLDNNFNEANEAKFVSNFIKEWEIIKKKFSVIIQDIEDSWEKKTEKKDKGYLG